MFLGVDCYDESNGPISGELASFGLYEEDSWWIYEEVGNPGNEDSVYIVQDIFEANAYLDDFGTGDRRMQQMILRGDMFVMDFRNYYGLTEWVGAWRSLHQGFIEDGRLDNQVLLRTNYEEDLELLSDTTAPFPRLIQDHSSFTLAGQNYGRTLEMLISDQDTLLGYDSLPIIQQVWISQEVGIIKYNWSDSTSWELKRYHTIPTVIQK